MNFDFTKTIIYSIKHWVNKELNIYESKLDDVIADVNTLLDNKDNSVHSGFVAQPEAPEDTSVVWIDTDDNSSDSIPVKGVDYWTETDKTEIVNDVIAALPVYNGEVESV